MMNYVKNFALSNSIDLINYKFNEINQNLVEIILIFFLIQFLIKSYNFTPINTVFEKTRETEKEKELFSIKLGTQILDGPLIYVVAHADPQYSETSGPPFHRSIYPLPLLAPPAARFNLVTIPIYSSCLLPVKDAFCQPQTRETGLYGDRGTPTPGDHRNRAQDTESREA